MLIKQIDKLRELVLELEYIEAHKNCTHHLLLSEQMSVGRDKNYLLIDVNPKKCVKAGELHTIKSYCNIRNITEEKVIEWKTN